MQKSKLPAELIPRLSPYRLDTIDLSGAALLRFDRGEWFLLEGKTMEYLLILLSGKAKVCASVEDGRSLILCYYVSEGIIGDVELMTGHREAISSMQAVTPLVCVGLPLSVYAQPLRENLPFVLQVGAGLAEKLDAQVKSSTSIILRPFDERLGDYLIENAENGMFSETLVNVAEQLGCSYRHLLRRLKALCDEGLLEKAGGGYRIVSESALKTHACR